MGTETKINNSQSNSNGINEKSSPTNLESQVPYLPIFIDESNLFQGAAEVLKAIRPEWDLNQVKFKIFTNGITNKLVGCFNQSISQTSSTNGIANGNIASTTQSGVLNSNPDVVLVRIYGNKTDLLIDRKAEKRNFKLLQSYGLAPALYATFKNGLAYEYLHGDILDPDSVLQPKIWSLVASRMAEMHRVIPINARTKPEPLIPMLWKKTQAFLDLVPETFSDPDKHKRLKDTFLPISRMRTEFVELYKHLEKLDSPLVFCHNDLLLGNVIHKSTTNTVDFIDYEYADYNFQAFDIGNHFAEFAGVDQVDYSRYPDRTFQLKWLRVYLDAYLGRQASDIELETLYVQVNQFALAAHFFWTVWSLIQAEHSTIFFDYVDYAYQRYEEYLDKKDTFLAMTLPKPITEESNCQCDCEC